MHYVNRKDEMPGGPHWAIIEFSTINIPGDERSRTHPGHGYPAHSEAVVKYRAYDTESEWAAEVEALERRNADSYSKTSYIAARVEPATITTSINVGIGNPDR